uniref:Uncharacterized protein n=1 Tax=Ciona intestinalis TaxID=7719 RepID=H2XPB3_CIOIN
CTSAGTYFTSVKTQNRITGAWVKRNISTKVCEWQPINPTRNMIEPTTTNTMAPPNPPTKW